MGPLITAAQRESVREYIEGVDVAFTGSAPDGAGFWMAPHGARPGRPDEPRLPRRDLRSGRLGRPLRRRGRSDHTRQRHGLRTLWLDLDSRCGPRTRVARGIETGTISINSNSSVRYSTPFGGFKRSGLGRELGPDALQHFSEEKNVFIATED